MKEFLRDILDVAEDFGLTRILGIALVIAAIACAAKFIEWIDK